MRGESRKRNKSGRKSEASQANEGGCGSGRAATSNPRQEKRRQKGLGAAYNSGLMAGWTRGRMGRATRRNSNGRHGAQRQGATGGGLQGRELRGHFRWRLHELPLPVAQRTVPPASAANVAVSSSASSFRPRPVVLAVGGRSLARSLAFLTPFFTGNLPLLPSLIYLPRSLSFSPSFPKNPVRYPA